MGILTPDAAWFTDKMPLNETHLGLIALLFPEAPLIHVLRHPLDIMVSAISNHFTHGLFCASALETAAAALRAGDGSGAEVPSRDGVALLAGAL